jgi:putative acetyltransferase
MPCWSVLSGARPVTLMRAVPERFRPRATRVTDQRGRPLVLEHNPMMHLRRAEVTDVAAIAEIHVTARQEAMPWLPELHSVEETREWVATIVLQERDVWIAEWDSRVAGYLAVANGKLSDLYVRPGYQGRGIGSALVSLAKAGSAGELTLWVFQRNIPARQFYEHHGFTVIEFTDGVDNEEHEPDVRYRWSGDVAAEPAGYRTHDAG